MSCYISKSKSWIATTCTTSITPQKSYFHVLFCVCYTSFTLGCIIISQATITKILEYIYLPYNNKLTNILYFKNKRKQVEWDKFKIKFPCLVIGRSIITQKFQPQKFPSKFYTWNMFGK